MNSSFFDKLQIKINSETLIKNELVLCLEEIAKRMQFPLSWQAIKNKKDISLDNFKNYEEKLHLRLYAVSIDSFASMHASLHPILFRIKGENNLFVFIKKKHHKIIVYNPLHHQYEVLSQPEKITISGAWQCSFTNFPLSADYTGLLKSISAFFKKDIFFALAMGIGVSFTTLFISLISAYVFSHVHEASQKSYFAMFCVFACFILFAGVFNYLNELYLKRLNAKAAFLILPSLWNHIIHLPLNLTKKIISGDLAQRAGDYEAGVSILIKSSLSLFFNLITAIILLGYMSYCNGWLALCYFGICLVFLLIRFLLFPKNIAYLAAQMAKQGDISSFLNEIFLQIHKIRSANLEEVIFKKWLNKLIHLKKETEKSIRLEMVGSMMETIAPAAMLASLYLILYIMPTATYPYLILQFIICAGQFASVIEKLSIDGLSILHLLPGIKRLKPIIEARSEIATTKMMDIQLNGGVTFSHVNFHSAETGQLILNDVSFHVEPGKFIAFIGPSGAGKSSIFKLLLSLDLPSSGEIKINNENICQFNARQIRQQIGIVLQTTQLLPGTIFSNISAQTRLTLEEAWELAKIVGIEEEINKMPMKMSTYISDNASESLSGGQKQKILIARALAIRPKILLLDEATSALDNRSQAHIYQQLQLMKITRMVIAHRYSTIVNADRIYKVNKGKIEEVCSNGIEMAV